MTFMRRPPFRRWPRRRGARPAAALIEIPQHAREQRHDPVLVQSRRVGLGQPAAQRAPKPGQLGERDLAEGGQDERALAGPPNDEALGLQLPVGLGHRVRVDGQRGDDVADLGQLVAGLEVAETQRVLDLMDELQVGRHAGGGVEPELDRRHRDASHTGDWVRRTTRVAVALSYCHGTILEIGRPPCQCHPGSCVTVNKISSEGILGD